MPTKIIRYLLPMGIALPLLLTGCTAGVSDKAPAVSATPSSTATVTWPAPSAHIQQYATAAGLTMLSQEGTVEHIHTHLTVLLNGRSITVPADIGIDVQAQKLSEIHTHDTSGIIHIESPFRGHFYLQQVFVEWHVPLGTHSIGDYVAGQHGVRIGVFANQKPYTGDLTKLELLNKEDVVLAITTDGTMPQAVPAFTWPHGY